MTVVILWVVRAGYPDVGYPMGCPGGLSGWGLSGGLSGQVGLVGWTGWEGEKTQNPSDFDFQLVVSGKATF